MTGTSQAQVLRTACNQGYHLVMSLEGARHLEEHVSGDHAKTIPILGLSRPPLLF